MKKQLLIAAVAATMASVSMADISITGGAKVNFTSTDTDNAANSNIIKNDMDFTIVGKTGDTAATMTVSNAHSDDNVTANGLLEVENAFVTSKVGDVNIKMGQWAKTSDTLLTDHDDSSASAFQSGRISLDTTVAGINVKFEDYNAGDSRTTISGEVAGVNLSHTVYQTSTDTNVKANVAGVAIHYRLRDYDTANTNTSSLQLDKEFNGMTFTYAAIDTDLNTEVSADAYIAGTNITDGNAFGVSMPLAGNTVQAKLHNTTTVAAGEAKATKLYLTRKLASGATFEAIYTDSDNGSAADSTSLDLELAVNF